MNIPFPAPKGSVIPDSADGWAFFLDIDGTLIDIAATPDGVVVPPGLPATLESLCDRTGGALALLTGRDIETVDRLFAPYKLPVGAVHGVLMRRNADDDAGIAPHPALPDIRRRFEAFAQAHGGALVEDKGTAVALHFRADPKLASAAEVLVAAALAEAGAGLMIQPGKMVLEVRPVGSDKGTALAAFMEGAAFKGRRPVAIGDDVTDEAMFQAAVAAGGVALGVGPPRGETAAITAFAGPADVRNWLAALG